MISGVETEAEEVQGCLCYCSLSLSLSISDMVESGSIYETYISYLLHSNLFYAAVKSIK